jgi:hypothetical protein
VAATVEVSERERKSEVSTATNLIFIALAPT